jgi:hypothetical protein
MISVICVYNDRQRLESCLLETLKEQTEPYELVLLDNRSGKYPSASCALNEGGRRAGGDVLLFVHQDMRLESPEVLSRLSAHFDSLGTNVVLGVAGKSGSCPDGVITNMKHGAGAGRFAGKYGYSDRARVDTLDECLVAVHRNLFERIQFDETICLGWHLYAVDYCLSARCSESSDVFVVDLPVFHCSDAASMNQSYFAILKRVCKKHRACCPVIYSTMGNFPSDNALRILESQVAYRVRKWLHLTGRCRKRSEPVFRETI